MKGPKIPAVASAVDLDFRYGCTLAWWQLWKGLYEVGVDLIVRPYRLVVPGVQPAAGAAQRVAPPRAAPRHCGWVRPAVLAGRGAY